jgi:hypothetical protein
LPVIAALEPAVLAIDIRVAAPLAELLNVKFPPKIFPAELFARYKEPEPLLVAVRCVTKLSGVPTVLAKVRLPAPLLIMVDTPANVLPPGELLLTVPFFVNDVIPAYVHPFR